MIKEACVGNLEDALIAQEKGADQIELCDRLDLDGTSPGFDLIQQVTQQVAIPVKVIVNPKPFEYSYTESELNSILNYVQELNSLKIAGWVFGPIRKDGSPDLEALAKFKEVTALPITFHKAIDTTDSILEHTEKLAKHGVVSSILSSGGEKTAEEGVSTLLNMKIVLKNTNSNIQLIGAGRITKDNLSALHKRLNLTYYHGKLIV